MTARIHLGELQRGFICLRPGREEHCSIETRRKQVDERLSEIDDWLGHHGREEMVEAFDVLVDSVYDFRVPVAEERAHLTRRKVQDSLAVDVPHASTLGVGDDNIAPGAAVSDQVV